MNQDIRENFAHPALAPGGVSQSIIDRVAAYFAVLLTAGGHAHVTLEPDDATRYEMIAVRRNRSQAGPPFIFASSFGAAYPWNGTPTVHPDYATEHYVANGNGWTGVVIALFLNAAAEQLVTR